MDFFNALAELGNSFANQNNAAQNLDQLRQLSSASPQAFQAYTNALSQRSDPYAQAQQQANLSQIALNNEVQRARLGQLPLEQLNMQSLIRSRDAESASQLSKLQRLQQAQDFLRGNGPLATYGAQSTGAYPMMVPSNPLSGLSPQIQAIAQVESGGNPNAVSPKGAQGLMQLMPSTAANPGFGIDPVKDNSPEENLRVGTQYFDKMLQRYGGDETKALAAYNAGPGSVDKALLQADKNGAPWLSLLPQETQNYVPKVQSALAQIGQNQNLPTNLPQQLPAALQNPSLPTNLQQPLPGTLQQDFPSAPVGQNLPSAPVQTPLQSLPQQGTLQSAPINSQALPQAMPFQTGAPNTSQFQPSAQLQKLAAVAEDPFLASTYGPVYNQQYAREHQAWEDGLKQQENGAKTKVALTEGEGSLRKEFEGLPDVKDYRNVEASYQRIQKAAAKPSAASDLALIYNYMKMLDPGSTVREGEFATAQNAGGIPDQIRAQFNKLRNGERLSPDQRVDFVNQAQQQYNGSTELFTQRADQYSGVAEQYGYDPKRVIQGARKGNTPTDNTQAASKYSVGQTATGPNGQKLTFNGKDWQ